MKLFKVSVILYLWFMAHGAMAYEIDTHARITQKAYEISVLKDDSLLADFAIGGVDDFGHNYFDVSDDEIIVRSTNRFDNNIIGRSGASLTSIQGWLMRGAIREDDCSTFLVWFGKCGNPLDDPVNENRPLNHFFDPINNRPLTIGIELGDTAVNWSLGTYDAFTLPIHDNRFINHFTMFDAREAQYRALTGHATDGSKNIAPLGLGATEPQIRDAYWATLFRAVENRGFHHGDMNHA